MERSRFDEYIARFNACDDTAFDDYIHPDRQMQNGGLVLHDIRVAHLSFAHTAPDGTVTQRDLAH